MCVGLIWELENKLKRWHHRLFQYGQCTVQSPITPNNGMKSDLRSHWPWKRYTPVETFLTKTKNKNARCAPTMFDKKKRKATVTTNAPTLCECVCVCENVAFLSLPLFFRWNFFLLWAGEAKRQLKSAQSTKRRDRNTKTRANNRWSRRLNMLARTLRSNIYILFIYKISEWHSERDAVGCSVGRFLFYWFPYRTTPDAAAVCECIRDTQIMSFAFVCFFAGSFLYNSDIRWLWLHARFLSTRRTFQLRWQWHDVCVASC